MNDKPIIAQKKSYPIIVEEGKTYYWCQCGLSKKQPFCDGSHKKTNFKTLKFTAEKSKTVYFCGCKYTLKQPFCDGSHKSL